MLKTRNVYYPLWNSVNTFVVIIWTVVNIRINIIVYAIIHKVMIHKL